MRPLSEMSASSAFDPTPIGLLPIGTILLNPRLGTAVVVAYYGAEGEMWLCPDQTPRLGQCVFYSRLRASDPASSYRVIGVDLQRQTKAMRMA